MPESPVPPDEDVLVPYLSGLRESHPDFGVPRLLHHLKTEHPEWAVSEKRVRKTLQSILSSNHSANGHHESDGMEKGTCDESNGQNGVNGTKQEDDELIAQTGMDATLNLTEMGITKVKVRMFSGGKGKGLVVREKIQEKEVLWQEEPWIVTPSPEIYGILLSHRICIQCFTTIATSGPSPPILCPHCKEVTFCNRLCHSKRNSHSSHPDILCPGQNQAAGFFWHVVRREGARNFEAGVKIIAKWIYERGMGNGKEVEKRIWEGMARCDIREKAKTQGPEGFAQFEVVWKRRYKVMSQMLDPDPESKEFKAMQKTLSRAKSNHQPFTEEERERWLSLDGFYQIVGLVTLNLDDAGGLYALHAHLNHSCEPTIRSRHLPKALRLSPGCLLDEESIKAGPNSNRQTYLARRPLNAGEELTISYVDFDIPRDARREHLRDAYGFWCNCPKCKREASKATHASHETATTENGITEIEDTPDQEVNPANEPNDGVNGVTEADVTS